LAGSSVGFFLHLFQKRISGDKCRGFFVGLMSFLLPANSVRALKETHSSGPTTGLALSFLHPPPVWTPDRRGIANLLLLHRLSSDNTSADAWCIVNRTFVPRSYQVCLTTECSGVAYVNEVSQLYLPPTHASISGMSHACLYSPAAERHRTVAGAHFPSH